MDRRAQTQVPALERGIHILRLLEKEGPLLFTAIVASTGLPRATVSRLLDALVRMDLVARSGTTRSFSACVRLTPSGPDRARLDELLHERLRDLSARTGQTAEWYIPQEAGLLLVNRCEPPDVEVSIRARIGFIRTFGPELEAVSILGNALLERPIQGHAFWAYSRSGDRSPLSPRQVTGLLEDARVRRTHADAHANVNGIRRAAAALMHRNRLVGVLALAEFVPHARKHRTDWTSLLLTSLQPLIDNLNT